MDCVHDILRAKRIFATQHYFQYEINNILDTGCCLLPDVNHVPLTKSRISYPIQYLAYEPAPTTRLQQRTNVIPCRGAILSRQLAIEQIRMFL